MNRTNVSAIATLVFFCIVMAATAARSHQLGASVDGYKVGDSLPFGRLEFIDNGGFDLEKCLGKEYVLLFFWSRYFTHYDDTLKLGRSLHSRYKGRNIRFLGINLDSNWKKVEKTLKEFNLGFPHTYNPYLTFPAKLLATISQAAGSVVIINKNGEVALLWQIINSEDYKDIQDFLDRNLAPKK